MPILDFITREWSLISQAPASLITGAILFGFIGFAIGSFIFRERISTLEERLKFANDKNVEYENKIRSIVNLRDSNEVSTHKIINSIVGNYITDEQVNIITKSISGRINNVGICWDMMATDATPLINQMRRALRSSGWQVDESQMFGGKWSASGIGIMYNPSDPNSVSTSSLLSDAFRNAGIVFEVFTSPSSRVEILISSKSGA